MKDTTLCYIESGGRYLMLHRTKKPNDPNHDKWLGVGGHVEPGETPEACVLREVLEETGLRLLDCKARGLVHFRSDVYEDEDMYLFTATRFEGTLIQCPEGDLEWVPKDRVPSLNLWQGDLLFLRELCRDGAYFDMTLEYTGDLLRRAWLDGRPLELPGH